MKAVFGDFLPIALAFGKVQRLATWAKGHSDGIIVTVLVLVIGTDIHREPLGQIH
jgi:hypothetical protein